MLLAPLHHQYSHHTTRWSQKPFSQSTHTSFNQLWGRNTCYSTPTAANHLPLISGMHGHEWGSVQPLQQINVLSFSLQPFEDVIATAWASLSSKVYELWSLSFPLPHHLLCVPLGSKVKIIHWSICL